MSKEAVITYETLFEILRREKNREEIQKLDPSFVDDVIDYFRQKAVQPAVEHSLFAMSEKEKVERQIANAKRLLKEIYERREKKILVMALNKAKTHAMVINTANLLQQEKELYLTTVKLLQQYRSQVLLPLLTGKQDASVLIDQQELPVQDLLKTEGVTREFEQESEQNAEQEREQDSLQMDTENQPKVLKGDAIASAQDNQDAASEEHAQDKKRVRFSEGVPKFIGPDLEMYGPFKEGDEAELPSELATVLVTKKRATQLSYHETSQDNKTVLSQV